MKIKIPGYTIITHNHLKKSTTGHQIYVLNAKIMIGMKTEKLLIEVHSLNLISFQGRDNLRRIYKSSWVIENQKCYSIYLGCLIKRIYITCLFINR